LNDLTLPFGLDVEFAADVIEPAAELNALFMM
jgi:hypothetical protein